MTSSREIKFRIWDPDNSAWFDAPPVYIETWFESDGYIHKLKPQNRNHIIMQYTGLKDKNGKDVFEGDIVKCVPRGCPHEIFWTEEIPNSNIMGGMPGFYLSGMHEGYSWTEKEEVIGNIWENPELLEGDEK